MKTPIDWDAKNIELNGGSIDCIWNGFTMNGREDDYTWTPAYINNTQVFAVNKNSGIKKAADLARQECPCSGGFFSTGSTSG